MNIAIDCRVLEKKITGIGRYLSDLLEGLAKTDFQNEYYLFSQSKIYISNNEFTLIHTGKSFFPSKLSSPFWLNFILPQYLKKYKIDLFFTPNHLIPLKIFIKNIKTVIVIHDLAHKVNKSYHPFFYNIYLNISLGHSIKNCDSVITVSNNSKSDIVKYFNVPLEKINVIYEHIGVQFKPIIINESDKIKLKQKFGIPENFILYVGVIEKRKNIISILKISDILEKRKIPLKVVLIGRPGYGFNKLKKEIILRKEIVKYLSDVEDNDLIKIYNLAKVFIFPSYFEGFGLPPLEAMSVGVPVVVSNSSSLPEVVGENIPTFDPKDYKGFADEIEKLYNDNEYYKKMKEKVLNRAKYFSHNTNILKLLNLFKKFNI